jgi:hypothetical protein
MRQGTTRHEPFYLTYGREATLPIDFLIPTSIDRAETPNEPDDLLRRIYRIIGNLQDDRRKAQGNIQRSQHKQKLRHDSKLRITTFEIGALVLLYKIKLKGHGKLEEKWKGPYRICKVLENGAYKLETIDRKVLKAPINGDRLKQYRERSTND